MAEYGKYGQDVEPWRRVPGKDEPQFRPEPSVAEKVGRWLTNDPGMVSPGQVQGLVMKGPTAAANADKLQEMIRAILPKGYGANQAEEALAYMSAKYPKLTGMVQRMRAAPRPLADKNESISGVYDPWAGGRIRIADDLSHYGGVNTAGHELTHAIQDKRAGRVPLNPSPVESPAYTEYGYPSAMKPSISGPGLGRKGPPFEWVGEEKAPYTVANEAYGYDKNPYETQADIGGETAANTYERFRDLRHQNYRDAKAKAATK